jgi:hypothetical protein
MLASYLNVTADAGAGVITHIGLVNGSDVELSGWTYARQPVSWTPAASGVVRPTADLVFDIPANSVVGGWRGYSAPDAGTGTNYGGSSLTQETFVGAGKYTLLATSSGISHSATV